MNLRLATEKEKFKILGPPGDESFLVKINLPMPFKLAWMKDYTVRRISCNKAIATALLKVYQEIAKLDQNIIDNTFQLILDEFSFHRNLLQNLSYPI